MNSKHSTRRWSTRSTKFSVRIVIVTLITGGVLTGATATAKPDLQGFLPRAVTVGKSAELKLEGKFSSWPVKARCNRPGLTFSFGEKSKMTVKVAADALPGVYLIRLLDSTGVSEPVPLVVDWPTSLVEKEPNNEIEQANPVEADSANFSGVLGKSGDVDCFRVTCQKGQVLHACIKANPLFGVTIDAVLQICDSRGFVLNQNDDRLGIDPSLTVKIPADGVYFVRTFAFPATPNSMVRFAGGADYRYLLTISKRPVTKLIYPLTDKVYDSSIQVVGATALENNDVVRKEVIRGRSFLRSRSRWFSWNWKKEPKAKAVVEGSQISQQGLAIPFDYSGTLSAARQLDWIPFRGKKGERIRFQIAGRRFGLETDPSLAIFDANGKQLVSKDDNSKTDPDLNLDFSPKSNGLYYVRVKDAADKGGESVFLPATSRRYTPELSDDIEKIEF